MDTCVFCGIAEDKISSFKIWEDGKCIAFLDMRPISRGHVLLIPKNHIEYAFDIDDDLFSHLFLKAKLLAPAIQAAVNSKRIGIAIEGFGVPHVHIHLVPLNEPNELNPEKAKEMSKEELKEVQQLIKSTLASS